MVGAGTGCLRVVGMLHRVTGWGRPRIAAEGPGSRSIVGVRAVAARTGRSMASQEGLLCLEGDIRRKHRPGEHRLAGSRHTLAVAAGGARQEWWGSRIAGEYRSSHCLTSLVFGEFARWCLSVSLVVVGEGAADKECGV